MSKVHGLLYHSNLVLAIIAKKKKKKKKKSEATLQGCPTLSAVTLNPNTNCTQHSKVVERVGAAALFRTAQQRMMVPSF